MAKRRRGYRVKSCRCSTAATFLCLRCNCLPKVQLTQLTWWLKRVTWQLVNTTVPQIIASLACKVEEWRKIKHQLMPMPMPMPCPLKAGTGPLALQCVSPSPTHCSPASHTPLQEIPLPPYITRALSMPMSTHLTSAMRVRRGSPVHYLAHHHHFHRLCIGVRGEREQAFHLCRCVAQAVLTPGTYPPTVQPQAPCRSTHSA